VAKEFDKLDAVPPPGSDRRENKIRKLRPKTKISLKKSQKRAKAIAETRLKNLQQAVLSEKKVVETIVKVGKIDDPKSPKVITSDALATLPPAMRADIEGRDVIFVPNPGPQTEFLRASEDEVFYGGARGGGKSYSLIVNPLRYCHVPEHRALILRRTMPELRDLIFHSQRLYPRAFPGAVWREKEGAWRFPSGARVEFGYAENMTDVLRYQGQSYSEIDIDELPQYESEQIITELRGSLRTTNPYLPTQMRFTGNPGNIGSGWVREVFINPAPPNTPFKVPVHMPDGSTRYITRKFIPAKLTDNPYLMQSDTYYTMLASLPETKRKQWLDGDWDAFDGAAFPEFNRNVHVIKPFPRLSPNWPRFRACDWGFSSPHCCLWFAVGNDGELYVYRELYGKGLTADKFAIKVLEAERGERIQYGVLDVSTWAQRGDAGPSIAETMIKLGCRWRPSDRSTKSRINGKMEVHRRLHYDEEQKQPKLFIYDTCVNLIRTLPMLPTDPNDPEDVDTRAEDHAYDALRYGVMSRPVSRPMIGSMQMTSLAPVYSPVDKTFGY